MKKVEIAGKKFSPGVETLNLSKRGLKEIPDLSAFTSLKELDLSFNQNSRINKFYCAPTLERLNLSNNSIKKIENLSSFTNLKVLQLYNNVIAKIENLELLVNLDFLTLAYNNIKKIEGLTELKKLSSIDLSYNSIKKIENLEELKKLRCLDLVDNHISLIESIPLNIKEIFLDRNEIEEIPNLNDCIKLYKIYICENKISSLSFDLLPRELLILYLSENEIEKIHKPKAPHNHLNTLGLYKNPIKKLEWMEWLPDLTSILVDGKSLSEISKETYQFILNKQKAEKNTHGIFSFFSSNTTTAKNIEDFVKTSKKVKIT